MSYSKHNYPGLTDPPPSTDPSMQQWMQQITEMLRQGTGQVGADDLRFLTWNDLEAADLVEARSSSSAVAPPGQGTGEKDTYVVKPTIDLTPPSAPRNVTTSGSPTSVRIIWDDPQLDYSFRAEVWISATDDVGTATLAGSSNGTIYQHDMAGDIAQKFFWVRFMKGVETTTITGPWNQTAGTPGQTAGTLRNEQLGQLDVDKLIGGKADFVEANIRDGRISNAMIGNTIQSNNYQPGVSGWIIKK